ncbi:MAG: penicillin-binding protein 2, partial [Candidatus Eremiobacterota bacterium]
MRDYRRRLALLRKVLFILLVCLAVRLLYLQAWRGELLGSEARQNVVRTFPSQAPRGCVFDCRGRVLVRNQPRYAFSIVAASLDEPAAAVKELARLAGLKPEQVRRLVQRCQTLPLEPLVISHQLDRVQLARLAEVQDRYPGARIEVFPIREYPLGSLAAHVLGQVGEVDEAALAESHRGHFPGEWVGKDGLELSWDATLRGRPGTRVALVDVVGRPVREFEERPPVPGRNLHLTLDAELQRVAEERLGAALEELRWRNGEPGGGVAVAMEVHTGKIRALASLPSYEPGWFATGISARQFALLTRNPAAPLLNRAIGGAYPPASTFKLVTAAAALAQGLVRRGQRFYCEGARMIGDVPFHCFVRSGHGWLTFEETLAHSCDVAYYDLGLKLGYEKLEQYARDMGLGEPTGVDLPGEVGGNLPDEAWKLRTVGEKWYAGDDANLSIGQGFLTVTPLQMAVVTAVVASGGSVVRPYLVERVTDPSGAVVEEVRPRVVRQVPVPRAAWERIRRGMEAAVAYGTSTRANVWGLEIAGKTGTVENLASAENRQGRNHTWFVCYAPAR